MYQDPLYRPNYKDDALAVEFLRDIRTTPPVLIVDASSVIHAHPLDPVERGAWTQRWGTEYAPESMQDVYAYVGADYTLVKAKCVSGSAGKCQIQPTLYRMVVCSESPGRSTKE